MQVILRKNDNHSPVRGSSLKISYILAFLLTNVFAGTLHGEGQTGISNYGVARGYFWNDIYADGGNTLYCGENFAQRRNQNIEHVAPAAWMTAHFGCGSRRKCRRTNNAFNRMEADLHNLYPSRIDANNMRGSLPFGEIPGEQHDLEDCDFEVAEVIEPHPSVRGDIARAVLYMAEAYEL